MDLKFNPTAKEDIDAERERREEFLSEFMASSSESSSYGSDEGGEDEEFFDATPGPELEALLPYYNQVEDEALKVAKKYFHGTFISDCRDVHNQKLFEYEQNGHVYRCYVDIYNENEDEINIIEVKATTCRKYTMFTDSKGKDSGYYFFEKRGGSKFPVFVKDGNFYRLNNAAYAMSRDAIKNFEAKKAKLLDRYDDLGKYPHDLAFQRYVIEKALKKEGDTRRVNYYLAVLNSEYVFDGRRDVDGRCVYEQLDGQELVVFIDMNEISKEYQQTIQKEVATLESYIRTPNDINGKVDVGVWCAWGKNTECIFCSHCLNVLRKVPKKNRSNNYVNLKTFSDDKLDKYRLVNEGYWKFDDIPLDWLKNENHKIQRDAYDGNTPHIDDEKMRFWLKTIQEKGPIYHFDFETFPCPLPRFRGEIPYRQSVFEFSLHIEQKPGVCDIEKDNVIFLNKECDDDEREDLVKAIVDNFKFDENGNLIGTMLAQNTGFEISRLKELAVMYPEYKDRLLAICNSSADLIHLLKTNENFYKDAFPDRAKLLNYYHKDLSGSYSIKKTLPVLVPELSYDGMDVGNGVQAYIAYLNYDSCTPTFDVMKTKAERREALRKYCQQDTWAMVEILRAVRKLV